MNRHLVAFVVVASCSTAMAAPPPAPWIEHQAANLNPTAAYRWLEIVLEASARSVDRVSPRPTILSREMAIAITSLYDAWAAYDAKAVGTRLGATLRRPPAERTQANKEKAIAYATHRALVELYPEDAKWLDDQMRAVGFDPRDTSTDPTTPQGVGNTAAAAVLAYRKNDGANQYGDAPGSSGKPYSDYTGYKPRNPIDQIVDPDRWQQIPFTDGKGGTVYVGYLTPQWGNVKPFVLEGAAQFRPAPYPKVGMPELAKDVAQVIAFNGSLTTEQKAIVEFMRDGPRSTGQSGHWLRFAEDVSRRDHNDLDRDVKLFFSVANVVFDAFIACWEAKLFYDSSRPWTLVRHLYRGKQIKGYAGPCKGTAAIDASAWQPYSPTTFVTPPFPGYPSGHSTASAAASTILKLVTGSDRFEAVAHRKAGELTEAACHPVAIDLKLPTFTATAEMAGISRVMGGYHIQADNVAGLELGRKIANYSWPKYQAYFDGTAPTTLKVDSVRPTGQSHAR
jgi:hypothetical protein